MLVGTSRHWEEWVHPVDVAVFFEEVLVWEHGVQFQLAAPHHTMVLLIGGTTVHSWGQVPINATPMQDHRGNKGAQGVDDLFERTQSL